MRDPDNQQGNDRDNRKQDATVVRNDGSDNHKREGDDNDDINDDNENVECCDEYRSDNHGHDQLSDHHRFGQRNCQRDSERSDDQRGNG
jgi:hypothetical protein